MSLIEFYKKLLELAQQDRLDDIRELPEAGVWVLVTKFSGGFNGSYSYDWFPSLNDVDKAGFAKAMAVFEDTVGSVGSCSALQRIFPLKGNEGREALDWVLQNTCAYDYFAGGALSAAELHMQNAQKAVLAEQRAKKEALRQAEAKVRIAKKATADLINAVRRGDVKAVRALIAKGADRTTSAPDGTPLVEVAEAMARLDIVELLKVIDIRDEAP